MDFDQSSSKDFHLFLIDYFEVLRKGIIPKKRKVYFSKELKLKSKSSDFKKWRNRLNELKIMFENGDNMNPFLSRQIVSIIFRKLIFAVW